MIISHAMHAAIHIPADAAAWELEPAPRANAPLKPANRQPASRDGLAGRVMRAIGVAIGSAIGASSASERHEPIVWHPLMY